MADEEVELTEMESLLLIAKQLRKRIAEVTSEMKPSYSVDGQSFSWESYMNSLINQLAAIKAQIKQAAIDAEGPFELDSVGYTTGGF